MFVRHVGFLYLAFYGFSWNYFISDRKFEIEKRLF